jgi:hypothetical protein
MNSIVVAFGLGLGTLLLGSVCWTYMTKNLFGLGGAVLSTFGLILAGMSVWNTVDVSVTASGITAKLDSRLAKIEEGVAQTGQRTEAVSQQLGEINSKIETIDKKLRFSASEDVDSSKLNKLAQAASGFQEYLKRIGYKDAHPGLQIDVSITDSDSTESYYNPNTSRIFINKNLVNHPDALFKEYMHDVLYSGIDRDKSLKHWEDVITWVDIEFALVDYFPASFLNSSAVYMDVDSWDLTAALKFENCGSDHCGHKCRRITCERERPWAATFWDIRTKLGSNAFDPLLLSAWIQLRPEEVGTGDGAPLVERLMKADQGRNAEAIRESFTRHGLEVAKL